MRIQLNRLSGRLSGLHDAVDDEIQAIINELLQEQADGLLSPSELSLLQSLQAEMQAPAPAAPTPAAPAPAPSAPIPTTQTLTPTTTVPLPPAGGIAPIAGDCCNGCRTENVPQAWYLSAIQSPGSVPVRVLRKRKTCESQETGNAKLACAEELAAFKRARGINGIRGLRGVYDDRM